MRPLTRVITCNINTDNVNALLVAGANPNYTFVHIPNYCPMEEQTDPTEEHIPLTYIVKYGYGANNDREKSIKLILHYTENSLIIEATKNEPEVLKQLIEQYDFDVNRFDHDGKSFAMLAREMGCSEEYIEILRGKEPSYELNRGGGFKTSWGKL